MGVVQAFSNNSLPLSKLQIREMVSRRGALDVFESWVRRFLRRHHLHLRARSCKRLSDKRVWVQMIENVKGFIKELKKLLTTYHFTPASVMKFDETRIVVKGGNFTTQSVIHASKEHSNSPSTCKSTVASLLTFAVANGSVFMSIFMLKAKFDETGRSDVNFTLQPATRVTSRSWPRYVCWTGNGLFNAELSARVMDLVADE